ncbi:MAG TPA: DUF503 domain-containing protein [Firmicutes bacterium]|nr:DUF503 domain-containing protein [Bacillota bacterium]
MIVGLLTIELRVASSTSLKDKRRVLQSLLTRARRRYNISVAEVGMQDHHKMAVLAATCVGSAAAVVHRTLEETARFFASDTEAEILSQTVELL